jgi:hypothetical protein
VPIPKLQLQLQRDETFARQQRALSSKSKRTIRIQKQDDGIEISKKFRRAESRAALRAKS